VNTTASVRLPFGASAKVLEGGKPLETSSDILEVREMEESTRIRIGSGGYKFTIRP
jgi:hypothetical protein